MKQVGVKIIVKWRARWNMVVEYKQDEKHNKMESVTVNGNESMVEE